MEQKKMSKVYAVDFDGTLCEMQFWAIANYGLDGGGNMMF